MFKAIQKWFLKSMWPEIRKMLEGFLLYLIKSIFQEFKEYIEKNGEQQRNKAKEKAKEAEQKAKEATNPVEAMKYRAREEAFNEMYEDCLLYTSPSPRD